MYLWFTMGMRGTCGYIGIKQSPELKDFWYAVVEIRHEVEEGREEAAFEQRLEEKAQMGEFITAKLRSSSA